MPTRPATPCRHPACAALVRDGGGYCATHKAGASRASRERHEANRMEDPARAEAKRIRSTAAWTRLARRFKGANPTCCDPFKEHGEWPPLTDHAHHVVPLVVNPDLAFDETNLRPLCTACHRRVESMVNAGQKTDHLFPPPLSNESSGGVGIA